ncbi:UNVERIFIED_CONTAM: hypothetical protein FKN15_024781, partial [Acipenser sinensis]
HMHNRSADSTANFIYENVCSMGLNFQFCVGQCYDGASVMSGCANGVQAKKGKNTLCCIYYAHRLNLVLVSSISDMSDLSEFFSVVQSLYNFIANSNTRHELFIQGQKDLKQTVLHLERTAKQTGGCIGTEQIDKIILHYEPILAVLQATISLQKDSSTNATGLKTRLESASFILYLHMLEKMLAITNAFSEQL